MDSGLPVFRSLSAGLRGVGLAVAAALPLRAEKISCSVPIVPIIESLQYSLSSEMDMDTQSITERPVLALPDLCADKHSGQAPRVSALGSIQITFASELETDLKSVEELAEDARNADLLAYASKVSYQEALAWARSEIERQESAEKNGRDRTSTWYHPLTFALPWKGTDGTWSWRNSLDHLDPDHPDLTALRSRLEQDLIEIPRLYGALAEDLRAVAKKRGEKTIQEMKLLDPHSSASSTATNGSSSPSQDPWPHALRPLEPDFSADPTSGRKRKAAGPGSEVRATKRRRLEESGQDPRFDPGGGGVDDESEEAGTPTWNGITHGLEHPEGKGPFLCRCGRSYTLEKNLNKHLAEILALSEARHQCQKCFRRFGRPERLKRHTCGRRARLAGSEWEDSSTITWNRITHGMEHKVGADSFLCKCGKSYKIKKSLQSHINGIKNLAERRYQCGKCRDCFSFRSELNRHTCGNAEGLLGEVEFRDDNYTCASVTTTPGRLG